MKWNYNGHVYWMVTAGGFFKLSAETGIVYLLIRPYPLTYHLLQRVVVKKP